VNFPEYLVDHAAVYQVSGVAKMAPNRAPEIANNRYFRLLAEAIEDDNRFLFAVIRKQLVTLQSLERHLEKPDGFGATYQKPILDDALGGLRSRPNERLWLVEFTNPHLYFGNSAKIADVVIRASARVEAKKKVHEEQEHESIDDAVVLIRLPNYFVVREPSRKWKLIATAPRVGRSDLYRTSPD
jgi:hypothetical protein